MVVEECMFDPYVAHANNYIQPCPAHEMTCKDIAQSKAVFLTVILSVQTKQRPQSHGVWRLPFFTYIYMMVRSITGSSLHMFGEGLVFKTSL